MIVRDHLPWLRVWPQISRKLILFLLYDVTISVLYVSGIAKFVSQPSFPIAMVGAALSLFLAFRTNSAYDRWWEARTLWGGLVNMSRTLARQAITMIGANEADGAAQEMQRTLVSLQISYVHALRCHLRGQNVMPELQGRLDAQLIRRLREHSNVPAALVLEMGRCLRTSHARGWIDAFRWTAIDSTLTELMNIQGGCERIKNTPLPKQYDYFPRLLVTVFCLLLPLGLVEGLGILTPLASTLLSFMFMTLDTIGRDIETPFENTVHDTPMTSLSRTIEINLRQSLGEEAPAPIQSVAGFIY